MAKVVGNGTIDARRRVARGTLSEVKGLSTAVIDRRETRD